MLTSLLRYGARLPGDILALLRGIREYRNSGATPADSYQSFVRLFCLTGGLSNQLVSRLTHDPELHDIQAESSTLRGIDRATEERAVRALMVDGFAVFERALPLEACNRLLDFALGARSRVRGQPGERHYVRGHPEGVRYDFFPEDVINQPDVQKLMCDPFLLRVAQRYLGAVPVADVTTMWWHTAFSDQPDEDAAQFYHFDLDRPKWLKVFCYLTDVGAENGPHCFVRGSHRNGAIPWHLRSKGYARLGDQEVEETFGRERIQTFTAPTGTILLEDTRGLHKGMHVQAGDRLMLQLQFSNSLFGGTYPPVRFRRPAAPLLEESIRKFPTIYGNYIERDRPHA